MNEVYMNENYWAARKRLDELDKIQNRGIIPLLYPKEPKSNLEFKIEKNKK